MERITTTLLGAQAILSQMGYIAWILKEHKGCFYKLPYADFEYTPARQWNSDCLIAVSEVYPSRRIDIGIQGETLVLVYGYSSGIDSFYGVEHPLNEGSEISQIQEIVAQWTS